MKEDENDVDMVTDGFQIFDFCNCFERTENFGNSQSQ